MRGRTDLACQIGQDGSTSHLFQFVLLYQFISYRDAVYGLMLVKQRGHSLEYEPMLFGIKTVRAQRFQSLVYTGGLQEHSP